MSRRPAGASARGGRQFAASGRGSPLQWRSGTISVAAGLWPSSAWPETKPIGLLTSTVARSSRSFSAARVTLIF